MNLRAVGKVIGRERLVEKPVLLREGRVDLLAQDLRVEDVLDADPEPSRLVRIGRSNPAPRRSDLEPAEPPFARRVERHMPGHDQVRVAGDPQAGRGDAARLEAVELLDEQARVDDAPSAHDADLAAVEDPRGDVVELEGLAVAYDRVPR